MINSMMSTTKLTNDSFPGSEITIKLPLDNYPFWCHLVDLLINDWLGGFGWRKSE